MGLKIAVTHPRETTILVEATSNSKNQSEARDTSLPYMRPETQNDLHLPGLSFLHQFINREAWNRKRRLERTGLAPSPHKSFQESLHWGKVNLWTR